MKLRRLACLASIVAPLVTACTSETHGTDPPVASTEQNVGSLPRATVETLHYRARRENCVTTVRYVKVSLQNAAVAKAINKVLVPTSENHGTLPDPEVCREGRLHDDEKMTVKLNERGLLSVARLRSSMAEGWDLAMYHMGAESNFDLRSGKVIYLEDALDERGREIATETCNAFFAEAAPGSDVTSCGIELVHSGNYLEPAVYTIEQGGLRLYPVELFSQTPRSQVVLDLAAKGALVPWAKLRGHIKHDLIKRLAQ